MNITDNAKFKKIKGFNYCLPYKIIVCFKKFRIYPGNCIIVNQSLFSLTENNLNAVNTKGK
jgi:hypothetical protein